MGPFSNATLSGPSWRFLVSPGHLFTSTDLLTPDSSHATIVSLKLVHFHGDVGYIFLGTQLFRHSGLSWAHSVVAREEFVNDQQHLVLSSAEVLTKCAKSSKLRAKRAICETEHRRREKRELVRSCSFRLFRITKQAMKHGPRQNYRTEEMRTTLPRRVSTLDYQQHSGLDVKTRLGFKRG